MKHEVEDQKLLAIVGPTASGKSDLAMNLARQFNGEIICADSRTIYKGMDIGTAKPTRADQIEVPHHLLDLLEPNQTFSAAEFKVLANKSIADIQARGKLPIIVGGSGLYAYAVIYDYQFPAGARTEKRVELENKTTDELLLLLQLSDPAVIDQIDTQNRRRIIRAIETAGLPRAKSQTLNSNILLLGLALNKEVAQANIAQRTEKMLSQGLIGEVQNLISKYGPECEALNTVGYNEVVDYLDGKFSQQNLTELINLHSWQLVRRQMTWFKRNPDIIWSESSGEALAAISNSLSR